MKTDNNVADTGDDGAAGDDNFNDDDNDDDDDNNYDDNNYDDNDNDDNDDGAAGGAEHPAPSLLQSAGQAPDGPGGEPRSHSTDSLVR